MCKIYKCRKGLIFNTLLLIFQRPCQLFFSYFLFLLFELINKNVDNFDSILLLNVDQRRSIGAFYISGGEQKMIIPRKNTLNDNCALSLFTCAFFYFQVPPKIVAVDVISVLLLS